jgi:hypothetical protein
MFVFENGTYLKTEFEEAFDCRDGSHFWGHPKMYVGCRETTELMKARSGIMVRPVKE